MQISEVDLEMLEVLTLQVPWYMICGEFAERYGGPGPLASRLMALQGAGFLSIRDVRLDGHVITAAELEADALANNCYADLEDTREPHWDMMATDAGYALVQERFAVQ